MPQKKNLVLGITYHEVIPSYYTFVGCFYQNISIALFSLKSYDLNYSVLQTIILVEINHLL
jgi:hypothetical protein